MSRVAGRRAPPISVDDLSTATLAEPQDMH